MARSKNDYPDFIKNFSNVKLPLDGINLNVLEGEQGQVGFFKLSKGAKAPAHSHKDSWATIIEGKMTATVGNDQFEVQQGDSWFVPAGIEHGVEALEDSMMIEVFCEQRFKL